MAQCNFQDPVLGHAAMAARGGAMCSFLIALAAFQRGLKVTFHRTTLAKNQRFNGRMSNGTTGHLFSIEDGTTRHFFNRTLGSLTSPRASAISNDKVLTKKVLQAANIRSPRGTYFTRGDTETVEKFIEASTKSRFVIKPVAGSLAIGAYIDIGPEEAIRLSREHEDSKLIIEEYVQGKDMRIQVVGEKCISALMRDPANVTGDGRSNIKTLVAAKNAQRARNPMYYNCLIELDAEKRATLRSTGLSLSSVPGKGEKVYLSRLKSRRRGADFVEVLGGVNDSLKRVCVACCKALQLPNSGLDVIVSDDPDDPGAYVLEANQRPFIGTSSFLSAQPWAGNAIAEAMIDQYFPETAQQHRFVNACFNFRPILDALASTHIDEVSLPVLDENWAHVRYRFPHQASRDAGLQYLLISGAHLWSLKLTDGREMVDALLSPQSQTALKTFRPALDAADSEMSGYLLAKVPKDEPADA